MTVFSPTPPPRARRASALVITLFAVTIVTLLTVTLLMVARYERTSSALALGKSRAEALADLGADMAIARITAATQAGTTGSTGKMWISEPGRIRVYERSNLNNVTDYNLFSGMPGPNSSVRDEKNVDLNRPSLGKEFPIAPPAPGKTEATMKVGWINLPSDPANPASKSNPIVGRVAYWVDDDSCKININTADGSKKQDLYRTLAAGELSQSFGFGTPSEISLEVLRDKYDGSGTNLSNTLAAAISLYAWQKGFNSPAEIGRIPNLPTDFYKNNKFNITTYSKTPELTFHGGPRMYLFPAVNVPAGAQKPTLATFTGAQFPQVSAHKAPVANYSEPIDFVYPTSKQLSTLSVIYDYPANYDLADKELPQYSLETPGDQRMISTSANFPFALRIAKAISGKKSDGSDIEWPAFNGAENFGTKYSLRQIDNIALQIMDLSSNAAFVDHGKGYSMPSLAPSGVIGGQIVCGVGRVPKFTEIVVKTDFITGSLGTPATTVPQLIASINVEMYFPKYYLGSPLNAPFVTGGIDWRFGNNVTKTGSAATDLANMLNVQDIGENYPWNAGALGGSWGDNLLRVETRATGDLAGIDLTGSPYRDVNLGPSRDPDQAKAQTYHDPFLKVAGPPPYYRGSSLIANAVRSPLLAMRGISPKAKSWHPGVYLSQYNNRPSSPYPAKVAGSPFKFSGGIALWTKNESNFSWVNLDFAPIDSLRGSYTGETVSSIKADLLKAVIPVDFTMNGPTNYSVKVEDPLVNKFPGDWEIELDPATITLESATGSNAALYGGNEDPAFPNGGLTAPTPATTQKGDNPKFRPAAVGGDPLSVWAPRQDVRYPKQSRFPSVGALNYVRTGMFPDDQTVSIDKQKGTPWRSINLSSTAASQTVNGHNYPDWAMLDLFTVPFIPQNIYYTGNTPTTKRRLTYGGATEGKLNINNPLVPYPFDEDASINTAPPERTAPLEALFYGLQTSTSYTSTGTSDQPVMNTVTAAQAAQLRAAIQTRLKANNPFLLPGQLAEVTDINNYTYTKVNPAAQSRNDLMRQVVGATTTQSNVFSIWITAQTIRKNPKNNDYGIFQAGDTVTGETRRHYVVERHLEYGKDGVPGNASGKPGALGPDGILATADDVIDADYHPIMSFPLPYRWKIVSVEDIPY